ncbi:MAG: glycoside hydrolase family 3 C-terminal domain-containing protein [Bacteroidales bacterium]|nr:glycoside hydrolase family 3 C-terminal domain-containing protein [Bacteroidales bacterium]
MKRIIYIICAISALAACTSGKEVSWQDKSLPAEVRAADLLSKLSFEEKASLVRYDSPGVERLGIPPYNWWNEALHGVARNGSATVFPQPIGIAASFDVPLTEQVFTVVSDEGRVKNRLARETGVAGWYQGLTFWTPNINIFRDPRWGRGMETYGEDPYLTGQMGMAVVRGLQGDPDAPVLKAHACAKHLAVHSGLEANRHRFNAEVSERDLRETYLPAFKDLVTKAGVNEVMTAYNRFRGVPCTASKYLVQEILRGEWGYKGLVVSDCWAISDFYEPGRHDYSATAAAAAAAAVANGVDVECGSSFHAIPEAYEQGLLKEEDLDRNLLRALTARFRLGEIDGESPWDSLDESIIESPEHLQLSLEMARESIVLLKNDGVLPLEPGTCFALLGPNADDAEMQWGNYNPVPKSTVTLLQALKAINPELLYDPACALAEGLPGQPELNEKALLAKLEGIETIVFAGGISPRIEGEEMPVTIPGFSGGDRTDIELPAVQRRLLQSLKEAGKKVILVNFSGGAIGLEPEQESCSAILQAWYPGQEGGTAITDVLFGKVNPSGKLPVTFYKNVGQLPDVEDYNVEGHTYRYFRGEPLYPFGYGLSYTAFEYGEPKIKGKKLEVPLTNNGKIDGDEVVQLYVRRTDDPEGPVKTLRGFQRVSVPAGGTVKVSFRLTPETFLWWDGADMTPLSGEYELMVGSSSADSRLQTLRYKF